MSLLAGLGEAFRRLDCAVLGASDYVLGGFGRFTGLDAGLAGDAINGLRRLRGCNPLGDVEIPTPFSGGQCATLYTVSSGNYTRSSYACSDGALTFSGAGIVRSRANIQGPIKSLKAVETFGVCGTGLIVLEVVDANDQKLAVGTLHSRGSQSVRVEVTGLNPTVTRQDGLPDNCGDPPPEYPAPTNFNVDVDVTYVDEGDNVINVTIPVEFKPFTVNFNGDIKFPFEFDFGGINFTGDVRFAPDFSLTVNPKTLPPGPVDITDPSGEPSPGVPLAPRGNKVQGVIVTATIDPDVEISSYEGGPVPDIWVPRLGSVKFAYSFGISTVWSNDIDVKGTQVFIPCPFSQGADAVQASPQPGVTFSIAQLTGPPLATVADLT